MKSFIPFLCLFFSACAVHKNPCRCLVLTQNPSALSSTEKKEEKKTEEKDIRDPFESFNRIIFAMNTTLDRTIFLPFIGGYREMPQCFKNRIISLMDTIETPISMANCLLQGKVHDFLAHTARLVFNTIFGLVGLFDVASALKIRPARQDFGKTLQKMACMPPGPYIVMPFLGPSTLRDCIGQVVDCGFLPATYWKNTAIPYYAASYLMTQAKINSIQEDIDVTFSDPYSTLRNAYFTLRGDDKEKSLDQPLDESDGDASNKNAADNAPPDLLGEEDAPKDTNEEKTPPPEHSIGQVTGNPPPDLLGEEDVPKDTTAEKTPPPEHSPGQVTDNPPPDLLDE